MKNIPARSGRTGVACVRARGFTLLEMMVAVVLGLLLTAGIVTLFSATGNTNRVQDGLARLQENGRFAMTRIDSDLRMVSGQYCSNFSGRSQGTPNGPQIPPRAPWTYAASLALPDTAPVTYAAATAISPRVFVQGYECSSGTCSPAVPSGTGMVPDVGTTDGKRLKGTDVLTIRHLTGSGWPVGAISANCATGSTITLAPQTGDDNPEGASPSVPKFKPNDIALFTDCQNPSLFPVNAYGSNVITLGTVLAGGAGGGPYCKAAANRDTRIFNFTTDFATVTYFVKLRTDPNPDVAGRMIPVLVRRENGVDEELVQGVERLDFVYGVRGFTGAVTFMNAATINASTDTAGGGAPCIDPPEGVAPETGCLWRAVRSVEAHALFDTVNNMPVSPSDQAFRYSAAPDTGTIAPPSGTASTVTGLPWGRMMRREFVSATMIRNSY